jgi:antitoxin (DNA-binding transcriptional repressor) of toxin-antitoxin stability system
MRLSITEARRRLPALVREVRRDKGLRVQISVRDEVVAELSAAEPEAQPGDAARKLLDVMEQLPPSRGPRRNVSGQVKRFLYGKRGSSRSKR